jgi:hypothetical protein
MPVFLLKRFATFLATLTLPIPLRLLLAAQPKLVTPVLQVVLTLKTARRDGSTHLVMAPLEFMQRQVEWRLCGGQIRECHVGKGSLWRALQHPPDKYRVNTASAASTSNYLRIVGTCA